MNKYKYVDKHDCYVKEIAYGEYLVIGIFREQNMIYHSYVTNGDLNKYVNGDNSFESIALASHYFEMPDANYYYFDSNEQAESYLMDIVNNNKVYEFVWD